MVKIKTPEQYINEENIIQSAGEYIATINKKALVIGGKKSLQVTGEAFFNGLHEAGVTYQIEEFSGYCTEQAIEKYTELTKQAGVGVVIGVGGGSVLDVVKAVAENNQIPVVTIPTIAATCAAWSALTVIYDENGAVTGFRVLQSSPKLVLADTKILVEAPVRYLQSGIGDTIVKWYETAPHASSEYDLAFTISLDTAKLALTILENHAIHALKDNKEKRITKAFKEVVDSIIVLAGLVGSINSGRHRAAVAHSIHNSVTSLPETKVSLHGEKVIFGLIVQFVLEGKSEEEIIDLIARLNALNLPVTLEQLGLQGDITQKIDLIANGVKIHEESIHTLKFEVDSERLKQAIQKADELGRNSLKLSIG